MAFGSGLEETDSISEINMTPLVDVMLVLLIIFILAVPVLTHSVNVDLPKETTAPSDIKPDTVVLAVNDAGEFFVGEDKVSEPELEQRLSGLAAANPQPDVHIRGDKKVAYELVMKLMAATQRAGLTKIGFVTQPE